MTAPAAILATFADFKLIKGRKVAQLVFEIPIEQADDALGRLGGLPRPDSERWFAIARMVGEGATPAPAKTSKPFHSLPYAQQAALKCGDKSFRDFLGVATESEAAIRVRQECGVRSRSEIESDDGAKARWISILQDFEQFQRGFR